MLVVAVGAALLAGTADDLPRLVDRHVPPVERATLAARGGDPTAVQLRYDRTRDLQAAIEGRAAPGCPALLHALQRYATANMRAAEAFDRKRPAAIARHDAAARAALADVRGTRCDDGRLTASAGPTALAEAERRASAVLSGRGRPRSPRRDTRLASRLRMAIAGFRGEAAAWVHDLATGRSAAVRADDRYPAASTVKLGVLVAALARYGVSRPIAHDLETMTRWSSNLAANRLHRLVGGDHAVGATLRRLGARASTYPGAYRAGTSRAAPPLVSRRVTTARDLGRILAALHGAAVGRPRDLLATGLEQREARVALGLLLAAEDGEGALVPPVAAARKHGWLSSARHTAALLYGPRGPVVVVLLVYRPGLTAAEAQHLGRRVATAALA